MSTESEVQEQKTEAQYATQASLISCIVTNNKGVELPPLNGDMILGFIHRESLLSPFMSGVLAISDSADFLNGLDMDGNQSCLLYTSPSPRDKHRSRMPSSA